MTTGAGPEQEALGVSQALWIPKADPLARDRTLPQAEDPWPQWEGLSWET